MINVDDEQFYAQAILAAQMAFKKNFGRFPNTQENNKLIKIVDNLLKEQKKSEENTKSDWAQRH